jgi:DNA-binding response OmpR family regulator
LDVSKRILLVDDEEQILECTRILLENQSFQVTTAENGEKARNMLDLGKFDVIITDLRMPGDIDGKALYHLILKEKPDLAPKMIFITGDTLDAETESFLEKIPNRCVKKPFTGEELLNSIAAVTNA